MDTVAQLSFENESSCSTRIYLLILDMLYSSARNKYPYHIPNVISNDELYGSDPKFVGEVYSMCTQVVELILIQLKTLGTNNNNLRAQCHLSLELFIKMALNGNIASEKTFSLAINLWNLSMKNRKLIDGKLPGKVLMKIESVMQRTSEPQLRHAFEELTNKMKVKM